MGSVYNLNQSVKQAVGFELKMFFEMGVKSNL